MQVIKGNFGECRIIDCIEGMKEVAERFDVTLTDYPFNVKFAGKAYGGEAYSDNMEKMDYINWCKKIFDAFCEISDMQLVFCGNPNVAYWCKHIAIPKDIAIWFKPFCRSRGTAFHIPNHDTILCYGAFSNEHKLFQSVFVQKLEYQNTATHPCPSNPYLYQRILRELNVKSVLDPFLGSGTTAMAAESLGIKWLGFELDEKYSIDIEQRIKDGIALYENSHPKSLEGY